MLYWLGIAGITGVVIYICYNLGLSAKIHAVCDEIVNCGTCSTFWGTLAVLLLLGCKPLPAFAYAICVSYLSNWFALLWELIRQLYDKLWLKINQKKK